MAEVEAGSELDYSQSDGGEMTSSKVEMVEVPVDDSTTNKAPPKNIDLATSRNQNTRRDSPPGNGSHGNSSGAADDAAWQIISAFLKGWFFIWVLFAVLVVAADLSAPLNPKRPKTVTAEGAQLLLEVSEIIVSACSYSNLDTAGGRAACQSLCRDHMCCFVTRPGAPGYGCADDPGKICPAHAGCQSLVVSEDNAIILDADGVEVFGDDSNSSDYPSGIADGIEDVVVFGDDSSSGVDASGNISFSGNFTSDVAMESKELQQYAALTNSTSSTELQLIQSVVESVCFDDNLHSHRGIRECAALCGASMCCFDRDEIVARNPNMDLTLKLELFPELLDLSEMGACVDEEGGNATVPSHFCEVHAGCKNLLLFGAPAAMALDHTQRRMLVTLCTLFGMIIAVTAYLLMCNRFAKDRTDWRNETKDGDNPEKDFAPVI